MKRASHLLAVVLLRRQRMRRLAGARPFAPSPAARSRSATARSRSRAARSSSATAASSPPATGRVSRPTRRSSMRAANGSRRGSSPVSRGSGLSEVDLGGDGNDDDSANGGPFSAAIDVAPAINPLSFDHRGQPRRRRHARDRRAESRRRNIFAGQGAVIDTGADMDPITRARALPVRRAGRNRRGQGRRIARFGACPVPQRVARGRREPYRAAFRAEPITRPTVAADADARRSEDVLLTRFDAAALVPVLQGRQYLLVHVERASDILQVHRAEARISGAQAGAGRRDRGLDRRRPDRRGQRPGDRIGGQ